MLNWKLELMSMPFFNSKCRNIWFVGVNLSRQLRVVRKLQLNCLVSQVPLWIHRNSYVTCVIQYVPLCTSRACSFLAESTQLTTKSQLRLIHIILMVCLYMSFHRRNCSEHAITLMWRTTAKWSEMMCNIFISADSMLTKRAKQMNAQINKSQITIRLS